MDADLRPIVPEELEAFARATGAAFGETPGDDELEAEALLLEPDRTVAVFDRGRIVATAAALSLELTLPGLGTVPAAGVTAVGVLPSHRRRGLLTAMMDRLLDQATARGEPLAALIASESVIYGRFGFGAAVFSTSVEIDTRHAAFTRDVPRGAIRLLDAGEARAVLPGIQEEVRRAQPGDVSRPPRWWEAHVRDSERRREGASARFYALHEPAGGTPNGYVTYRVRSDWAGGVAAHEVRVGEVAATSPEARLALWRYVLDLDLAARVTAWNVPLDEPLRWVLADPRRLRVARLADWLWVRLLDVPAALAARRYAGAGRLVLEVADPFRPAYAGRVALEADASGAASCAPTGDPADLALTAADLGAAYLGGVRLSNLARAGRVEERTHGSLGRADALFACEPLPFTSLDF